MTSQAVPAVTTGSSSRLPRRGRAYAARALGAARGVALTSVLLAGLAACSDSVSLGDDYELEFDFSKGYQGWVAGFVDYPVGKETEWAIGSALAPLPAPLDASRSAILLAGENHSDDLFMYVTREISGLTPNARYAARFRVTLATNAPKNCVGIGGAPGESVVLKVGATAVPPARVVAGGYYRANFDYGQQLSDGRDAGVVGDLATSNANCALPRYELKAFDSGTLLLPYTAGADGRLWLIVGIDSGFEGRTAAYITSVRVEIDPR